MRYTFTHRLSPLRSGFAVLVLAATTLTLAQAVSAAPEGERPTMDNQTGAPYPILTAPGIAERAAEPPRSRPMERIASAQPEAATPRASAPAVALAPVAISPVAAPLVMAPRVVDLRRAPAPIAPTRSFRMPWQIGVYQ